MKNKPLNEDMQRLVLDNYNLIYTAIKGFHIEKNYSIDMEDLQQMALFALCKASRTYDKAKGTEFSTYAVRCMRNHISNELRNYNNSSVDLKYERISLDEGFDYCEGSEEFAKGLNDDSYSDRIDASIVLMDLDNEIRRMENSVSGNPNVDHNLRLQAHIMERFMDNRTVEDTCSELNISPATYYRQLNAAKKHLAGAIQYS